MTTDSELASVVSTWLCMCSVAPVARKRSTWLAGLVGSVMIWASLWLPRNRHPPLPDSKLPPLTRDTAPDPGFSVTVMSSSKTSPASSNPKMNSRHWLSGPTALAAATP